LTALTKGRPPGKDDYSDQSPETRGFAFNATHGRVGGATAAADYYIKHLDELKVHYDHLSEMIGT
jgi:hypothetical protein